MRKIAVLSLALFACSVLSTSLVRAEDKPVGITPDVMKVTVKHGGKDVDIMRAQDNAATVNHGNAVRDALYLVQQV